MKLKLRHIGLILVAVPLAFELLVLLLLSGLLGQAEHELVQETHAKSVIFETQRLSRLIYAAGAAEYMSFTSSSPVMHRRCEEFVHAIPEQVRLLRQLVRENRKEELVIDQVEKGTQRVVNILTELGRMSEEDLPKGAFEHVHDLHQEISSAAQDLTQILHELENRESEIVKSIPQSQVDNRQKAQLLIWLAVGFSVVLAVGLAMFFSKQAVERIARLIDNTVLFAGGKTIHPPLAGSDEFAHLDSVFHGMVDKVEAANQLKREVVAMVSHDLRTPLTSIQATLSLLADGAYGDLSEKGKRMVDNTDRETTRLMNLIRDLLDVEKLDSGSLDVLPTDVPLARIIDTGLNAVRAAANAREIGIETPAEAMQTLRVDEDRIVQVFVNFLSNAIKFSPEGSLISITVADDGPWTEVSVIDRGRGIAQDSLLRVFERFQQADATSKDRREGSGLGLAICKAIVEAHQGKIGVESEFGKGSRFWFRVKRSGT